MSEDEQQLDVLGTESAPPAPVEQVEVETDSPFAFVADSVAAAQEELARPAPVKPPYRQGASGDSSLRGGPSRGTDGAGIPRLVLPETYIPPSDAGGECPARTNPKKYVVALLDLSDFGRGEAEREGIVPVKAGALDDDNEPYISNEELFQVTGDNFLRWRGTIILGIETRTHHQQRMEARRKAAEDALAGIGLKPYEGSQGTRIDVKASTTSTEDLLPVHG